MQRRKTRVEGRRTTTILSRDKDACRGTNGGHNEQRRKTLIEKKKRRTTATLQNSTCSYCVVPYICRATIKSVVNDGNARTN